MTPIETMWTGPVGAFARVVANPFTKDAHKAFIRLSDLTVISVPKEAKQISEPIFGPSGEALVGVSFETEDPENIMREETRLLDLNSGEFVKVGNELLRSVEISKGIAFCYRYAVCSLTAEPGLVKNEQNQGAYLCRFRPALPRPTTMLTT